MITTIEQKIRQAVKDKTAEVLTEELARELKGKKIATIYFGYKGQDGFDEFVVGDIKSRYDLAKEELNCGKYANRAEYWESYMSEKQLYEVKNELMLLKEDGTSSHHCAHSFNYGAFTGSDSDRFVYFIEIKEYKYIIKHSTKGYYQNGNWIYRSENSNWATHFNTIEEAIETSKKLTVLGSNDLLGMVSIVAIVKNEFGLSIRLFAKVFPKLNKVELYGENGKAQLL